MSKQDRQGARTVAELNRRYDVKKAMGVANDSLAAASQASATASKASSSAAEAQKGLEDKIDKTDDSQVVAMVSRSEDTLFRGENFAVTKDGTVVCKAGKIGDWNIGKSEVLADATTGIGYEGTVLYSDTFTENSEEITVYLTPEKLCVGWRKGLEVGLDFISWADIVRKLKDIT